MTRLALAYLLRRPVQLLAVLGMAVGLLALLVVLSVMNGLIEQNRASVRAPLADLMLLPAVDGDGEQATWRRYRDALSEAEGVTAVAPHLVAYAMIRYPGYQLDLSSPLRPDLSGVQVVGIDPAAELLVNGFRGFLEQAEDRPVLDPTDPFAIPPAVMPRPGVLVSDAFPLPPWGIDADGHANIPPRIELGGLPARLPAADERLNPVFSRFDVAGTYARSDYHMAMDRIYVERTGRNGLRHALLGRDAPDFTEALIRLDEGVDYETGKASVQDALRAAGLPIAGGSGGGSLESWEERSAIFLSAIDNERRVISLVLFFIVIVASFGLFATLSALVREKVRDLGVLAAIGYSPLRRGSLLLGVGALGSALGAVLGHWGAHTLIQNRLVVETFLREELGIEVFSSRLYVMQGIPAEWQDGQALQLTLLAFLVGIVFTSAPALRAALLRPTSALRYE